MSSIKRNNMFALVDCNNFYASCERLFRPDLRNKPIVVLSNNDGCVIARSNEAKLLGIKMGAPYFQIKDLCKQHKIHIFSSNYALYGDMSNRVMRVIEEVWSNTEIYSIDEAFLDLSTLPNTSYNSFCIDLQRRILKSTGIPVSIGIGETKTLAKIANYICKKRLKIPVFNVCNQRNWLKHIEVHEIWGVSHQWSKKLNENSIYTAHDLATINIHLLRKQFNVTLMRTAMELQGTPCSQIENKTIRQSIISSKSFGEMQTDYNYLAQAISSHCARAWEKLRSQGLVTQHLSVFVITNRFRPDLPQHSNSIECKLVNPTDDLRVITHHAKLCLNKIYKSGFQYKKVGIGLADFTSKGNQQFDLFDQPNEESLEKKDLLMNIFANINQKYGHHTIKLAAEGYNHPWAMRSEMRSPSYTTKWSDLPMIKNLT